MPGATDLLGSVAGATPWGSIASAAGGLISGISGLIQRGKGRKMLRQLGDQPQESIPDEVLQNQTLAQQMASTGMPSEQYNNAMKNIQRQQVAALQRAADRRGGLGLTSVLQQGTNDAVGNLDVKNAELRNANRKGLISVNNQVAGWKDKVWNNNVLNPWMAKYNYANSLIGMGNQNFNSGIDKFTSGGIGFLAGGNYGQRTKPNANGNSNQYYQEPGSGYPPWQSGQ